MKTQRKLATALVVFAAAMAFAGCQIGPSVSGNFDRSFDITDPVRLELSNISGNVVISGSADGKIHVHGEVRVGGFGFGNPEERLQQIVSAPPIELKGGTLRIGRDLSRIRNVSIAYTVDVPRNTTVNSASVSGSQSIRNINAPVQATTVSGSISAQDLGSDARFSSTSGSIQVDRCGDNVRASSVSGTVTVSDAKGDVLAHSVSGDVHVKNPGGRVDADTSSGSVNVVDGNGDVKARTSSGGVRVQGNPSGNSYWDLKTASGTVGIAVPASANFHFSANAVSGQISTDVPIIVDEQGKHSLRAHMGDGGGRVEIHTLSGGIHVRGAA